jgi:hypothetical protein
MPHPHPDPGRVLLNRIIPEGLVLVLDLSHRNVVDEMPVQLVALVTALMIEAGQIGDLARIENVPNPRYHPVAGVLVGLVYRRSQAVAEVEAPVTVLSIAQGRFTVYHQLPQSKTSAYP